MSGKTTDVRIVEASEMNYLAEAQRIQNLALSGRCHVVKLGQIVFFSTCTGDAWMLDPEDRRAVCLARDHEYRRIPITETAQQLTVAWNAEYAIEGAAFTVSEPGGALRAILGYPTDEIQRLIREYPAKAEEVPPETQAALAHLTLGRNEACTCGSGKKYKKCCLPKDEAVVRQLKSANASRTVNRAEVEGDRPSGWRPTSISNAAADRAEDKVETAADELSENDAGEYQDPKLSAEENRDDPIDHLERVFHLLAWAGCEDELFELARITAEPVSDADWLMDDSTRWLCLREAIPFLASGACSVEAATRLFEAQRIVLGPKFTVPVDREDILRQLRCTAAKPIEWKLPSLPGRDLRGIFEVSWNFCGWLGRDRGRGWVRSMHLAQLLVEYWSWPSHDGRAGDPFHLEAGTPERYINWQEGGDLWATSVASYAFLQAVVWFGEYLVARGYWAEPRCAELRRDGARIYASKTRDCLPTEVALRVYPSFDALIA